MSRRYNQLKRRLARVEELLGLRSEPTETPIWVQVDLEAEQELSPEDLLLLKSGRAARHEGRFHSLEEHAVSEKFGQLRDAVARRHGFTAHRDVLDLWVESQPKPKRMESPKEVQEFIQGIHWGTDNWRHIRELLKAQQSSTLNSSASVIAPDPPSDKSS
jgi:hypothetical protein